MACSILKMPILLKKRKIFYFCTPWPSIDAKNNHSSVLVLRQTEFRVTILDMCCRKPNTELPVLCIKQFCCLDKPTSLKCLSGVQQ